MPRRDDNVDESLHEYSLLGGNEPQIYDEFNEGNGKFQQGRRSIVLNSSPVKDMEWVEEGQRFDTPGRIMGDRTRKDRVGPKLLSQ